jgi:hypothetical protein
MIRPLSRLARASTAAPPGWSPVTSRVVVVSCIYRLPEDLTPSRRGRSQATERSQSKRAAYLYQLVGYVKALPIIFLRTNGRGG